MSFQILFPSLPFPSSKPPAWHLHNSLSPPVWASGVTPPLADCDSAYMTFIMSCGSVGPKLVSRVKSQSPPPWMAAFVFQLHPTMGMIWKPLLSHLQYLELACFCLLNMLHFCMKSCIHECYVERRKMQKESLCGWEYEEWSEKRADCLSAVWVLTGHSLTDDVKNKGISPTSDLSDLLSLHCSVEAW